MRLINTIKRLYYWLHSHTTGQPWTFFSRDVWHKVEYLPIMLLLFVGWLLGYHWQNILDYLAAHPIASLAITALVVTAWYVAGHIYWGTKYEEGQKDD